MFVMVSITYIPSDDTPRIDLAICLGLLLKEIILAHKSGFSSGQAVPSSSCVLAIVCLAKHVLLRLE